MALNAFLALSGSKTGAIKGSARQKTREGKITVVGYEHFIESARDPKNGAPTDTRHHHALVVTKEIDLASPMLHKAHAANDTMSDFDLQFFRMPPTGGQEENHYTIKLNGAKIAWIRSVMRNNKSQENSLIPELEEVAFTYEQIAWGWKAAEGNSTGSDQGGDFRNDDEATKVKEWLTGAAKDIGAKVGEAVKDAMAPKGGG